MTADLPDRAADRERDGMLRNFFGTIRRIAADDPTLLDRVDRAEAAALAARPAPDDGEARRGVPTNAELAERAEELDAHTVVRNWLERHRTFTEGAEYLRWLDWAASNFLADPEIAQHLRPVSNDPAAPSSLPPDTLRQAVADELARHADRMAFQWDDDTVRLSCRCGFDRGTCTKRELAADLDGRMRAHRLHVADAILAVLGGEGL